MGDIISFTPKHGLRSFSSGAEQISQLAANVVLQRRTPEDVFWLKENAEFLGLLRSTGLTLSQRDLDLYVPFYLGVKERIAFFPQYYRFFLSITSDLEALGLDVPEVTDCADQLCRFVLDENLVRSEMSDLQRAEARMLLQRNGYENDPDSTLTDRLLDFASHSITFGVPNRKAAYELTHIVFYLTHYGARTVDVPQDVTTSLLYAGLIAFLEENADLLSEICLAINYLGGEVPARWSAWLKRVLSGFRIEETTPGQSDAYHCFVMCQWYARASGSPLSLPQSYPARGGFISPVQPMGALREVSSVLCNLSGNRVEDWNTIKSRVMSGLSSEVSAHLCNVSTSTPQFNEFFRIFARVKSPEPQSAGTNVARLSALIGTDGSSRKGGPL